MNTVAFVIISPDNIAYIVPYDTSSQRPPDPTTDAMRRINALDLAVAKNKQDTKADWQALRAAARGKQKCAGYP
jgi:hypothetical protein